MSEPPTRVPVVPPEVSRNPGATSQAQSPDEALGTEIARAGDLWWTARFSVPAACAVMLVLAQICYPLTSGIGRDRITVVVVLLSAGTALAHATATRGLGSRSGSR